MNPDRLFLEWSREAGNVIYTPDAIERAKLAAPSIPPGSDVNDDGDPCPYHARDCA